MAREEERQKVIEIPAAVSLISAVPAHRLGAKGQPYRYNPSGSAIEGRRNLWSNGGSVYPSLGQTEQPVSGQNGTLILGGGAFWNSFQNDAYSHIVGATTSAFTQLVRIFANGEMIARTTDGTNFGAANETFVSAGTAGVTNLSTAVTGNGTAWLTDVLTGYGTYTPGDRFIQANDLIGFGAAGSRTWYRIVQVNTDTSITIYPAYQGATTDPIAFVIRRTGRGSNSRVIPFAIQNAFIYLYYCGGRQISRHGRMQAITSSTNAHVMAPRDTAAAEIDANDIIYWKGWLLYGAGTAIGWSVNPFPSAPATAPFGANDFPALNRTVIDATDEFIAFEKVGDQLFAIFENGVWGVYTTGGVPEFLFRRLPDVVGGLLQIVTDAENPVNLIAQHTRSTCSGHGAIYYISARGLEEFSGGGPSVTVSEPIVTTEIFMREATKRGAILSFEPVTHSVMLRTAGADSLSGKAMMYQTKEQEWYPFQRNPESSILALTAGQETRSLELRRFRVPRIAYVNLTANQIVSNTAQWDIDQTATGDVAWVWATPIIHLSDFYEGFQFGGFAIEARGPVGQTPLLTWTVWGGGSPYQMTSRLTGSYNYLLGTSDVRNLLGAKLDDPYIGIVLSGTRWIEGSHIRIYDAGTDARR